MIHLVCAMAYGDCLVTLSAMEQLPQDAPPWRVIGTRVTAEVSGLLRRPLPVTEVLPDKAAFYTIKERGPRAAVRDLLAMRGRLRGLVPPGDRIAFEREDVRNRLLVPPGTRPAFARRTHSAYADRRALVAEVFGPVPEWAPARRPAGPVRRILVNPCARYRHRWLSGALMENLLGLARSRGWEVTLVDPCGQYASHAGAVARYVPRTPLAEAAQLLAATDLYIGPDSFFVHLAYYLGVPCFGFFYSDNLYFLLPGADRVRNWCLFQDAEQRGPFERALDQFLNA